MLISAQHSPILMTFFSLTHFSARDYSAKPSYKSIVVDEARRKTYDISEEQSSSESDPIFDVFSAEPKELIGVC